MGSVATMHDVWRILDEQDKEGRLKYGRTVTKLSDIKNNNNNFLQWQQIK